MITTDLFHSLLRNFALAIIISAVQPILGTGLYALSNLIHFPCLPADPGRPIPYVDEVALTFPQLKMVCGHVGYPWTDEMVSLAWKYDNIYIGM